MTTFLFIYLFFCTGEMMMDDLIGQLKSGVLFRRAKDEENKPARQRKGNVAF
jgi:hypothetical protein